MKTLQVGPMTTLKRRVARFGLGISLASMLALSAVMPALADNPGLIITGSPVSVTAGTVEYNIDGAGYGATNTIALNGIAHTIAIKVPVAANDYSGNDAGWNTTFSLTQFTKTGAVLLGETALSVTAADEAACDTTDDKVCSNANAAVENAVNPTTYTTGGTAIKIFSSDNVTHVAGIGMGQYTYETVVAFTLPSTAKAGTYSSTLTVTAVAAP